MGCRGSQIQRALAVLKFCSAFVGGEKVVERRRPENVKQKAGTLGMLKEIYHVVSKAAEVENSAGDCLLRAKWWAGDFTCCGSLHSYRLSAYQTGWD